MYDSMTQGAPLMPVGKKLSALQKKGQVTIPLEMRQKWNLKTGDLVAFIETEKGILISPQEVVAMDALNAIGAALKEKGITLEQLMEDGRKIRGKLVTELYGLPADET